MTKAYDECGTLIAESVSKPEAETETTPSEQNPPASSDAVAVGRKVGQLCTYPDDYFDWRKAAALIQAYGVTRVEEAVAAKDAEIERLRGLLEKGNRTYLGGEYVVCSSPSEFFDALAQQDKPKGE